MSNETIARCPRCDEGFDATEFAWTCSVCGKTDPKFHVWKSCENCRFGPRLIQCPSCSYQIEALLLTFSTDREYPIVVPYDVVRDKGSHVYRLGDLDGSGQHGIGQDGFAAIGAETLGLLFSTEFRSCFPVAQYRIVSHLENPSATHWLHFWLYAPGASGRRRANDDPTAQMATRSPSVSGKEADIVIVDVLVGPDWRAV